jgi:hypothetical protein
LLVGIKNNERTGMGAASKKENPFSNATGFRRVIRFRLNPEQTRCQCVPSEGAPSKASRLLPNPSIAILFLGM